MSRTTSHIAKDIDTVLDLYEAICFNITAVHGDKKFNIKTLKAHLLPIFKHIYSKEENVGTIKRIIRIIKKLARCMCNAISYQYYTELIIQSLISCVVKMLNIFPTKVGIFKTMRPCMIVKRKPNPDLNQERIVC